MPADRAKTIAFAWNGNTYVFSAGQFEYTAIPDREDWPYANGTHDSVFNWLDLQFTIMIGYLDQQMNAGSAYTLQDESVIASAPAVGVVDVLNALLSETVSYYPVLEDNAGNVFMTNYEVLSRQGEHSLMAAETAGRFTPYLPVQIIVQEPLTDYPAWANR